MPSAFVLKLRSHMLCATWATERDGRRAESVVRGVHQLTFRADGEAGPLTFLVSHTSQNVEYEGTVRTAPCAACAVRVRWNAGFQRATYFLSFDDWAPDSHPLGRRAHSDCVCLSESLFVGALFLWAKPNGVAVVIGRFEGLLAINFQRVCTKLGCKSVVDRDPTAIPRTRTVQAAPVRARKTVRAQCSRIRSVQASTTAEAGMADVVYPFDSLCRQHTCMYLSLLAHSLQHGHCQQRLLGPRVVSADP